MNESEMIQNIRRYAESIAEIIAECEAEKREATREIDREYAPVSAYEAIYALCEGHTDVGGR